MIGSEAPARPTTTTPSESHSALSPLTRYVPLLVWLLVIITFVLIAGKIIGYGFLPMDDALRHAAKAVSGKPWSEILILRPGFLIDPHPGWHAVLGFFHKVFGLNAEKLVVLSVAGLLLLLNFVALPWLKLPEAWLASLLVTAVCIPRVVNRMSLGRPYIFTMSAFVIIILLWTRLENRKPDWKVLIPTTILIALPSWIHGSWYQLGMPIAGLVLAGYWRSALWYGGCWAAGSFLGCALTGHPFQFLFQCVHHLFGVFGDFTVARELVQELLPSGGDPTVVLAIAAIILWRSRSVDWSVRELRNPLFMMAVFGWVAGMKVYRFWDDWGLPAAMLWMALQFQAEIARRVAFGSLRRLLLAFGLALAVYLNCTADINSRYTWNLTNEYLTEQDHPDLKEWLPGNNGIIYSADMRVFNETFFKNPTAPWRYILGFESGLMPPEDLAVVRKVQWNFGDVRAYEPWIEKMRPEDRLVLRASWLRNGGPPNLPQLEWKYAVSDIWVGKLPAQNPRK